MGRHDSPTRKDRDKDRSRHRDIEKRRERDVEKERDRRKRSTSKDRKHRSRSRDRRRSRSGERRRTKRSRSRERKRSRSRSRDRRKSRSRSSSAPKVVGKTQPVEEVVDLTLDEDEMMKMMGFSNFDTTKGKKVAGNDTGAVHVVLKRKYRQYMNRKGGFNRPLDFTA